MDEDTFNLEVRKLLKTFGVGAQREIEKAVDEGLKSGRLNGNEALAATIRLEIPEIDLSFAVDGDVRLS